MFLLSFAFVFSQNIFADQTNILEAYLDFSETEIIEIDSQVFAPENITETFEQYQHLTPYLNPDIWQEHLQTDSLESKQWPKGILRVGQALWDLVLSNKSHVDLEKNNVSVLPDDSSTWSSIENWQPPVSKTYEINYKNGWGMNVVKLQFKILYTYGGQLQNKGRYLSNVTLFPSQLNVAWGYEFNAKVNTKEALNLGSIQDPIAGIGLEILWNINTSYKKVEQSENFFIQGDGPLKRL